MSRLQTKRLTKFHFAERLTTVSLSLHCFQVRVTVYQLCSDELISHPRDILPNISEKLIDIVRETITSRPLTDEECQNIRGMLSGLQSPSNPVYCLLWERAKQFFSALS